MFPTLDLSQTLTLFMRSLKKTNEALGTDGLEVRFATTASRLFAGCGSSSSDISTTTGFFAALDRWVFGTEVCTGAGRFLPGGFCTFGLGLGIVVGRETGRLVDEPVPFLAAVLSRFDLIVGGSVAAGAGILSCRESVANVPGPDIA